MYIMQNKQCSAQNMTIYNYMQSFGVDVNGCIVKSLYTVWVFMLGGAGVLCQPLWLYESIWKHDDEKNAVLWNCSNGE